MSAADAHTQGNPIPVLLPKKISAKDSAITALMPERLMVCGACSRDEPQPKLEPPKMMGFGLPVFVEAFVPEHDSRQFVKRDAFKEAGRDDAVRVHVRSQNGNAGAGDGGELGQRHKGEN